MPSAIVIQVFAPPTMIKLDQWPRDVPPGFCMLSVHFTSTPTGSTGQVGTLPLPKRRLGTLPSLGMDSTGSWCELLPPSWLHPQGRRGLLSRLVGTLPTLDGW